MYSTAVFGRVRENDAYYWGAFITRTTNDSVVDFGGTGGVLDSPPKKASPTPKGCEGLMEPRAALQNVVHGGNR